MVFPRILVRLQRALFSPDARTTHLAGALFGYPPPALDASRTTAWLDGLRGVAALLVMTYHYHLNFWGIVLEAPYGAVEDQRLDFWRLPFVRLVMCAGHAQVSVFFVLSGFVLSWSSLGSLRRGRYEKLASGLASATFRRWLRLYLPCFAIGLVSLVEMWFGVLPAPGGLKDSLFAQLWDYVKQCERFADPFWIDRPEVFYRHEYNWTMWTIPREFNGSLLVFLLVLSVSRIQDYRRRTIVIGSAVFYALVKARWDYFLFTYGVLLADYIQEAGGFLDTISSRQRLLWTVLLIFSMYLAGVPEKSDFYPDYSYSYLDSFVPTKWMEIESGRRFVWCWAGIFFVTSCCHLSWTRSIFASAPTRYLGRISYMLYVIHRPVWEIFGQHFKKLMAIPLMTKEWNEQFQVYLYKGPAISTFALWLSCWIVIGPLAFLVAHWCEVFVDAPSVRLAKRVDQAFINGSAPPQQAKPAEELQQLQQLPS